MLLAGSLLSPLLRRLFPMRAILLSEFWMALVYAAFLAFPNVYVLAVAASLHAFWFPNTDSAIQAYSYTLIPDRLLGRAMAAANTLRAASAPLGPLARGAAARGYDSADLHRRARSARRDRRGARDAEPGAPRPA